jgi:hypothetical protein
LKLLEQQGKTAPVQDQPQGQGKGEAVTGTSAQGEFTAQPGATVLNPLPASFKVPQNWKMGNQQLSTTLLVSDSEPGIIVVHAGIYENFESCLVALSKGFQELKMTGQVVEGPREEKIAGLNGIFASYQGQAQDGTPVAARYRAVLSGRGVGIMVCGITTPEQIHVQGPRVDEVARTFKLGEFVPDRAAMAAIVGQWAKHQGSTSGSLSGPTGGTSSSSFASFTFNPDGTYSYSFEGSLSASTSVSDSGSQTSVFSGSSDSDQGRYFVAKGALILASSKGGCEIYEARMEGGRLVIGTVTYVR